MSHTRGIVRDLPNPTMQEVSDTVSQGNVAQWITAAIGAGAGLVIAIQKMMKGWASDRRDRTIDDAQTQIVDGLRTELARLHEQNGKLARAVNDLQLEVAKLSAKNARLTTEIAKLLGLEVDQTTGDLNG